MSDEEDAAAFDKLSAAVNTYYNETAPDVYVEAWVLATHKMTPELERESSSMVGLLVKEGQSFVTTRGLLDVALQADRESVYSDDDEDEH